MLRKSALLIRFSSFGDIVQTSFVAEALKQKDHSKVDLVTKSIFVQAFEKDFSFDKVYSFESKKGLIELFNLAKEVNKQNYSLIYDAHNNQRTLVFKVFLTLLNPFNFFKFKTRSKFRLKRFFLFKLRINFFDKPFKGAESFLKPLFLKLKNKPKTQNDTNTILLAPSAAWGLKKWPQSHWIDLGKKLSKEGLDVVFIGGPQDSFIEGLSKKVPNSKNLSGKLSWQETKSLIKSSRMLISGDTGVLHIADYFSIPAIALMGPSAFGFPSRDTSQVINKNLKCQPCSKDGRGKCKNKKNKLCLTSISSEEVFLKAKELLK